MESGDDRKVHCVVCLDEGCEWCPAVDAAEDEPGYAPPPDEDAA